MLTYMLISLLLGVTIEDHIEQLNLQERRLLESLDGMREKERNREARLDGVRRKKQMLLDRHSIRDPRPRTTPGEVK